MDPLIRSLWLAIFHSYSRVAQVVEQVTVNHRVGGSSPSSGAVIRLAVIVRYDNGHSISTGARCRLCVTSVKESQSLRDHVSERRCGTEFSRSSDSKVSEPMSEGAFRTSEKSLKAG